jgi:hypothetical protein
MSSFMENLKANWSAKEPGDWFMIVTLAFAVAMGPLSLIVPQIVPQKAENKAGAPASAPATEIVAQGNCKSDPVITHEQDGKVLRVTLPPGCNAPPK